MKRSAVWITLIVFVVILSACTSAQSIPTQTPTARIRVTKTPSPIPPTRTPTPTISPTPTFVPITPIAIPGHYMALDADNAASKMVRLRRIGKGSLNDIEYSPDGKYLAVATSMGVFLYDAKTYSEVLFIDVGDDVETIAFNPDGTNLAMAQGNVITLWNIATGKRFHEIPTDFIGNVWQVVYGEGGYISAMGSECRHCDDPNYGVRLWNAVNGELLLSKSALKGIVSIDISLDGTKFAYWNGSYGQHQVEIYNIQTGTFIANHKPDGIGDSFHDMIFSFDGTRVIFAFNMPVDVRIWDFQNNEITPAPELVECFDLARNGNAAICSNGSSVTLFDTHNMEIVKTLKFHEWVEDATISPDSKNLAIINEETVEIWDTLTAQIITSIEFDGFISFAVGMYVYMNTEQYLAAVGTSNGDIRLYELTDGDIIHIFKTTGEFVSALRHEEITGLAFSPDRHTLASIDGDGLLRFWNINEEKQTYIFDLQGKSRGPILFSSDGTRLAMPGSSGYNILELDVDTGLLDNMSGPYNVNNPLYGPFTYSPEGQLITWKIDYEAQSNDILARNLTLDDNQRFVSPISDYADIDAVAISANGNLIAFGAVNGDILLYNQNRQELLQTLKGHEGQGGSGWVAGIRHIEFSPNSDLLISVGWDGTTRLWDVESGEQIRLLLVDGFAEFTPDGRFLVTSGDGVIRVWGIPPWP